MAFRVLGLLGFALGVLLAAAPAQAADDAAQREVVRYRLQKWRTVHLKTDKALKTVSDTFTKLKVENTQHKHGDHIDLRYRCPKWKEMRLEDHATAHKWETWLKKYGFETQHEH